MGTRQAQSGMTMLHLPSSQHKPHSTHNPSEMQTAIILASSSLLRKGTQIPIVWDPSVHHSNQPEGVGPGMTPITDYLTKLLHFIAKENLGPERETDFPKVTQQVEGRPRSQETEVFIPSACFPPCAPWSQCYNTGLPLGKAICGVENKLQNCLCPLTW